MLITASAVVDAPVAVVRSVLTDVASWPEVFPSIHAVHVRRRRAQQAEILADHGEGEVLNVLTEAGPDTIVLDERKARYDATFINRFAALPGGATRYSVIGELRLRGWARALGPVLGWYGRRQLARLTVQPVKTSAEAKAKPTVAG